MPTDPAPSSGALRRIVPFVVLAAAVVAVVMTLRAWSDERAGSRAVGRAATCYYDGAAQSDCPTPRTGAPRDTAWVWAAVVDTLYTRAEGTVGPATLIALDERLATPPALPAGGPDPVPAALVVAAPALPRAVADTLATALRTAGAGTLPTPLWTVGAKQRRYDPATAARAVGGQAQGRDEAIPPRGLLALSHPAIAGEWALAYAERTIVPERADETAVVERRWVLCSRLSDGRWRAVRVVEG
jgi:hypothetical protein